MSISSNIFTTQAYNNSSEARGRGNSLYSSSEELSDDEFAILKEIKRTKAFVEAKKAGKMKAKPEKPRKGEMSIGNRNSNSVDELSEDEKAMLKEIERMRALVSAKGTKKLQIHPEEPHRIEEITENPDSSADELSEDEKAILKEIKHTKTLVQVKKPTKMKSKASEHRRRTVVIENGDPSDDELSEGERELLKEVKLTKALLEQKLKIGKTMAKSADLQEVTRNRDSGADGLSDDKKGDSSDDELSEGLLAEIERTEALVGEKLKASKAVEPQQVEVTIEEETSTLDRLSEDERALLQETERTKALVEAKRMKKLKAQPADPAKKDGVTNEQKHCILM